MSNLTKGKILSILLGLAIGIPVAVYRTKHKTPNLMPREAITPEYVIEVETYTTPTAHIEQNTVELVGITEPTTEMPTEAEFEPYSHIPLRPELQKAIKKECEKAYISYDLILAVIRTESNFIWKDGDNGNAIGYMQIWPKWWQGFAEEHGLDLYTEYGNITCGILIINKFLNDNEGDLRMALNQYNTGDPFKDNGYADIVFENYKWVTPTDQSNCNP